MANPLQQLFEGTKPDTGEFNQFRDWLRSQGRTETALAITLSNYKNNPLYQAWRAGATPTAPVTAPTATPTTDVDPVDYVAWRQKLWWEDPELDKSTIPQLTKDLQNRIDTTGFNEFYEGYDLARDYINSLQERGEDWVGNWQGSGRGAVVDKQGNLVQLYGETPSPEDKLTAYEEAQVGLSKEQLAFQKQQAQTQTQYQQEQLNLSQMQEASRLAGLGDEGWIERWYAQQAEQAKFPREGRGLSEQNIYNMWAGMPPQSRAWALDRYGSQLDPASLEALQRGFARPTGELGAFKGAEGRVPQIEPDVGWLQQETERGGFTPHYPSIDIKPDGEIKITETPKQAPSTGSYRDVYAGKFPVGEASEKKQKARPKPTAPPTPAWLPQFAPWLTPGQPIEGGQVATPSGQMWAGLKPSEIGGFKGFTQAGKAGRSFEDIYAHMLQMQPKTPRGGGWGRWGPVSQRV